MKKERKKVPLPTDPLSNISLLVEQLFSLFNQSNKKRFVLIIISADSHNTFFLSKIFISRSQLSYHAYEAQSSEGIKNTCFERQWVTMQEAFFLS